MKGLVIALAAVVLFASCASSGGAVRLGKITEVKDDFKNTTSFVTENDVFSDETIMKIPRYSLHQKMVKETDSSGATSISLYLSITASTNLAALENTAFMQIGDEKIEIDLQEITSADATRTHTSGGGVGNSNMSSSTTVSHYRVFSATLRLNDEHIKKILEADNIVWRFYASGSSMTFNYKKRITETLKALIAK